MIPTHHPRPAPHPTNSRNLEVKPTPHKPAHSMNHPPTTHPQPTQTANQPQQPLKHPKPTKPPQNAPGRPSSRPGHRCKNLKRHRPQHPNRPHRHSQLTAQYAATKLNISRREQPTNCSPTPPPRTAPAKEKAPRATDTKGTAKGHSGPRTTAAAKQVRAIDRRNLFDPRRRQRPSGHAHQNSATTPTAYHHARFRVQSRKTLFTRPSLGEPVLLSSQAASNTKKEPSIDSGRPPQTSGRDRTSRHRNRATPSTPSVTSEGRVRAHESLDRAASLKASRTMQRSREVPAEGKRPALMPSAPCHEHSYRAVPPKGGGSTARSPMPRRSQTSSESPSTPTGVEGRATRPTASRRA